MAKKLKDILKLFNEQINSNEMSSLLSASNPAEVEITDEGYEEIKTQVEGLLTVESAQTNREVKKALYKLHEKTIKTDLEEKLSALAEKMEAADGYKSAKTVEEKIDFLTGELDNIKKPPSGADAEAIKQYKEQNAELHKQINALKEEKEQEVTQTKAEYEQRLTKKTWHNYLSNKFKLADAYQKGKIKQSLFDDAFNEISKKAIIKLNEQEEIELLDRANPESPLFIKNKPAGVDDLVSPILQDYIQVSDPNPPKDPKPKEKEEPQFQPGSFAAEMARKRNEVLQGMSQ